ncbi:MAG: undecaprenyl/decaprenyl-phosphate alpha-N-acetylglucosaminyl 1-phosphate transferase [Candidatus Sumerlaeia bacterium]|nr:undecaprenyl/decaprenyl-phosphate alpha-N-acetylglucosaminyl 1-phosphate transferase [Candidatus Sumerlaeia bacterium]
MAVFVLLTVAAFVQALVVGAVLTRVARALGPRLGLMDAPTLARKTHAAPIPRSGGLALFAAFWGCLGLNLLLASSVVPHLGFLPESVRHLAGNIGMRGMQLGGIALGCLMIFVLGVVDDRWGLSPRVRLVVQILAVLPLVATGTTIQIFLPWWAGAALTVFWLVLLTNSFNFLDNMNGLSSGVAAIVAGVLALQSALAGEFYMMLLFGLLGGAAVGFWLHNFPRASVFLGDCGSTHLGFLLGALTVVSTYYKPGAASQLPVLMPLIVLGVPLFDTLSVLWIRWRAGRPLMEGDTNHFSHRLVALGMSRTEAVLVIYGVTLCVGLAAVVLRALDWRYGLVQTAMIVLLFVAIHWIERLSRRDRPPKANGRESG